VLVENKAAMMTVQRTTEVINRRRNTFDFEGVWVATTTSDMRVQNSKRAGALPIINYGSALPGKAIIRKRKRPDTTPASQ